MTVEDNDPLASKPAALSTLFEVLMQQNIVTSEESYLALKCIGVPPTEEEFVRAVQRTIAASATAPVQSGQWVHCSPALIKAGVSCANTPRRACACDPENVGHDHFIAHIAAPAQSCGDAEQAAVQQAKTAPFVMSLHDVVEMWNSVIADSFEDELIEFAAKAINFYKDSLPGSAAPNVAEQADEAVTDDVFDWLETEVTAISCRYHGDPSYDHDAYWMRDRVVKLIEEARNAFAARAKDSK